jgi:hypothetical protein
MQGNKMLRQVVNGNKIGRWERLNKGISYLY